MKNTIFDIAKQSLETAIRNAELALHAVLAPYGYDGIEVNTRPNDMYFVMAETEPNVFKRVVKVRTNTCEGLQMLVEGEDRWKALDVTDYKFLLDEVENAIRAMGDDE